MTVICLRFAPLKASRVHCFILLRIVFVGCGIVGIQRSLLTGLKRRCVDVTSIFAILRTVLRSRQR